VEEAGKTTLYQVKAGDVEAEEAWLVNNESNPKLRKLKAYFERRLDSHDLLVALSILSPEKEPFSLDAHTQSVFLGVFLGITRHLQTREFKTKWASITVTGDLRVDDDSIGLLAVEHIAAKYQGTQAYATKHPDEQHLFCYVSNEEQKLPPEDRIDIKYFTPGHSIEDILACLFELDDEQNLLLNEMFSSDKGNWDTSIERPVYIPNEKLWNQIDKNIDEHSKEPRYGFFIHGEGESGKSALARNIAEKLVKKGIVYAPLWLEIANKLIHPAFEVKEEEMSKILGERAQYGMEPKPYLKELLAKCLGCDYKSFDTMLVKTFEKQKKPYLIIVDNLELDEHYLTPVLQALGNILKGVRQLWVIVTSREQCDDSSLKCGLGIGEDFTPAAFEEKEIRELVCKTAIVNENQEWLEKAEPAQKDTFIKTLYENLKDFPGLIIRVVNLLNGKKLADVTKTLQRGCGTGDPTFQEWYRVIYWQAFSLLSPDVKWVLFSLMATAEGSDIWKSKKNIFSSCQLPFTCDQNKLSSVLDELVKSLIIKKKGIWYAIKSIPYITVLFDEEFSGGTCDEYLKTKFPDDKYETETRSNPVLPGKIRVHYLYKYYGQTLRETLIPLEQRLVMAFWYGQPVDIVKPLLDEKIRRNGAIEEDILYKIAQIASNPESVNLLINKYHWHPLVPGNNHSSTALEVALMSNPYLEVIQVMLSCSSSTDKEDKEHKEHLIRSYAIYNPNPDVPIRLIEIFAMDINKLFHHVVCRTDNPKTVKALIEKCADIHATADPKPQWEEVFGLIGLTISEIETASDPEPQFEFSGQCPKPPPPPARGFSIPSEWRCPGEGYTPIQLAVKENKNPGEIIEILLACGARDQINERDRDGYTLLMRALENEELRAEQIDNPFSIHLTGALTLIKEGAELHIADGNGKTPLHRAVEESLLSIVEAILNKEAACIHAQDKDGKTPLHYAIYSDHRYSTFVEHQPIPIDFDPATDEYERVLSCYEYHNKKYKIIAELIKRHADIRAQDKAGKTPLMLAASNPNPQVAIALIQAGAKVEDRDNDGIAALEYLRKHKDWPAIEAVV
jgi:ankyrin repeat protein